MFRLIIHKLFSKTILTKTKLNLMIIKMIYYLNKYKKKIKILLKNMKTN